MKNVKLSVMAALLVFILAAGCAWAGDLLITLTNKTDARVFVAIGVMSEGGEDDGDYSRGWWGVAPGETKTLRPDVYSPVCGYSFYATSLGGKRVWSSKEGNTFWIHPSETFKTHPDHPIQGGKQVMFRYLSVDTVERSDGDYDGKASITFALK